MSEPFLGEIRIVPFNFAPSWWARCNGQLLPLAQNTALFSLLGTQFGGNGQTTFALPDLRGRTPIHEGPEHALGERAGAEQHTLTPLQMPAHGHAVQAAASPASTSPVAALPAAGAVAPGFRTGGSPDTQLAATAIGVAGGSQPHENMQPSLVVSFVIALQGIFPSQN